MEVPCNFRGALRDRVSQVRTEKDLRELADRGLGALAREGMTGKTAFRAPCFIPCRHTRIEPRVEAIVGVGETRTGWEGWDRHFFSTTDRQRWCYLNTRHEDPSIDTHTSGSTTVMLPPGRH